MKYLKNGHAVEVITELPGNGGFVVETYSEDGDSGEAYLSGDRKIVNKVFDSPPVAHIAKEYSDLQEKLSDIRKQVSAAEKNARDAMPEWNRVTERLSQVPGLQRIVDFIDGKFTHVVTHQHGDVEIVSGADLKIKGDSWKRIPDQFRLITLFGDTEGNVSWKISKYKCDSGNQYDCILCLSQEDAMQKANHLISSGLEDATKGHHYSYFAKSLLESADKLGITVDEKYREMLLKKELSDKQEKWFSLKKQLDKETAELQLLKQRTETGVMASNG